jgi:hypothetical protein
MGTVHDLLTERGKQGTLALDVRREIVEAAATYMSDEESTIGFLYSGWCQAALPHKRQPDDAVWEIETDRVALVIEPGRRKLPGQASVPIGVPYGSRARLILLYLQSEALRTGSRDVELGRSLRQWLGRMGISIGGKSVNDVREQADRIARCRITFHATRGKLSGLVNQTVMDEAMFVADDDDASVSFVERAKLSESFFRELQKHPVPLEDAAICALSNNSQGLDIYCWLAYRLHVLTGPTPITWAAMKAQFGVGVTDAKNFRRLFMGNLELALAVYPAANVERTETGLLLHPSRPPVAPKLIAAR